MSEQLQSKKISVGLVLSWIFGILFALIGIVSVFSEPISGIIMLAMAAVLLPPIVKLVDDKWKFHLSGGIKIIVIIIGFIIFGATVDKQKIANQDKPQQQAQEQQQNIQSTKNDEEKPIIEEQPKTDNNQEVVNTKKTEIIPAPNKSTSPEPQKAPTEIKSNSETNTTAIIGTKCEAEWPNDAKMKNYCIEQQNDGLTTLNLGKPKDMSDSDFLVIRNKCKSEWPTDFKMRAYCESQQYDGVRTLKQGKPTNIGQTEFGIIRPKCESEWPTDFKMRAYCESEQYNAVRTLNQGKPANVSESDFKSARSSCSNEWPTDFKMRVYCENQKY